MSKTLQLLLVAALALAILALAPYLYVFNGGLSQSSHDWSDFGSYLGGTLGPLYAMLAFVAAAQALLDNRQRSARQALLVAIQRYEAEFESACSCTVTCKAPLVWDNAPDKTSDLDRVSLRTLLYSYAIDWEKHLSPLILGHDFQVLPTGEISQDGEVVNRAYLAIDGIFKYLDLYKSAGGDIPLVEYLMKRYDTPRERLESAMRDVAEWLAEIDADEHRKNNRDE